MRQTAKFLIEVVGCIDCGAVQETDKARDEREQMGLTPTDRNEIIRELTVDDLESVTPSSVWPDDQVWTFTPPWGADDTLWIRLCLRDGLVVISFHADDW